MFITLSTLFVIPSWSFAVIGDTQSRPRILKRAVRDVNNKNIRFTVHLGDLSYCSSKWLWKKSRKEIRKCKTPWFYVLGNHELYSCSIPVTYHKRKKWVNFWYSFGSTMRVFKFLGKKFILLDSATAFVPRGQIARLKLILNRSSNKSVFIFTHRPLPYPKKFKVRYSKNRLYWHTYKVMGGMWYAYRNKNLWKVLKNNKSKILAVFHGHYHAYRKYRLNGITVYCSGGGGGTLETSRDYYHYLKVTVRRNKYFVKVVRLGK